MPPRPENLRLAGRQRRTAARRDRLPRATPWEVWGPLCALRFTPPCRACPHPGRRHERSGSYAHRMPELSRARHSAPRGAQIARKSRRGPSLPVMNTAEPAVIQEVAPDHPPAMTAGNPSGPERYWLRLLRAVTLVFVGVTVHLWIDGPLPSLRIEAPWAGRLSDGWADARSAPVRRPRILRAPQAADALPTVQIEPGFPVAAS